MTSDEQDVCDPFAVEAHDADSRAGVVMPASMTVAAEPQHGAVMGQLVAFDLEDRPLIRYRHLPWGERIVARTVVPLQRSQLGGEVVMLCERGDPHRPIIMGVVQTAAAASTATEPKPTVGVHVDGTRHEIVAEREIVLRCGDASITLTRAGKVIIKGTYVLSRSSGYNKIKGAAVDIN